MMFFEGRDMSEDETCAKVTEFLGPSYVDQFVRQAVQHCWMCLPKDKQTPEELEKQIRRLVDRALKDFQEDREAFGK